MKKIIVLVTLLLVFLQMFSQNDYRQTGNKVVGVSLSSGANNIGVIGVLGYHVIDDFSVNINGGFRKFKYRDYSEKITEVGLEGIYSVYSNNEQYLRSELFSGFNISLGIGVITEFVTNTSEIILADPYPQLYYGTGAVYAEVSIVDDLKIVAHFKQWIAVNEDKDISIGKNRYDFGIGLRYYFY